MKASDHVFTRDQEGNSDHSSPRTLSAADPQHVCYLGVEYSMDMSPWPSEHSEGQGHRSIMVTTEVWKLWGTRIPEGSTEGPGSHVSGPERAPNTPAQEVRQLCSYMVFLCGLFFHAVHPRAQGSFGLNSQPT